MASASPRPRNVLLGLAGLAALAGVAAACGSDLDDAAPASPGRTVYLQQCASCHGSDRDGVGVNPALAVDRMQELGDAEIRRIVVEGQGAMTGFDLEAPELDALVAYLLAG
jgi:mono/diheme cytochrome c family protein